jgi:hypothetical protein
MRRQVCCVVAFGIAAGTGLALTGGSLQEAIRVVVVLLTGVSIGLGLARR